MTNGEKFKTARERENAFWDFCEKNVCLNGCPLYKSLCDETRAKRTNSICHFAWLDLEAEEEKPLPCPFCGGGCELVGIPPCTGAVSIFRVKCEDCSYQSGDGSVVADEAIAAHNRVAKAVAKAAGEEAAR